MEGTVKRGKKAYATAVPASSYKVQELKRSQLFNCTIDNLSKAVSLNYHDKCLTCTVFKIGKAVCGFFFAEVYNSHTNAIPHFVSDPHGRELGLNLTRNDLLFVNVMIRKNLANDSSMLSFYSYYS